VIEQFFIQSNTKKHLKKTCAPFTQNNDAGWHVLFLNVRLTQSVLNI